MGLSWSAHRAQSHQEVEGSQERVSIPCNCAKNAKSSLNLTSRLNGLSSNGWESWRTGKKNTAPWTLPTRLKSLGLLPILWSRDSFTAVKNPCIGPFPARLHSQKQRSSTRIISVRRFMYALKYKEKKVMLTW